MQHVVQVGRGQARPAHILLLGGIGHQARKIIDAQPLHRQALDHGLYHPVQMLILGGLAQGDTPAGQNGGQGETPENLAVEVFHQQARKQRKGGVQSRAAAAELLLEKRSVILRGGGRMQGSSGL